VKLWRRVYEERRRIALPLLVVLIANVAILALAVFPLQRSVAGYENDALDFTAKLGRARRDNRQTRDARTAKNEADQELKKFYADVLPADYPNSVRLVLFWVGQAARESRVTPLSTQADHQPVHESRLERVSCHVTLRGDYQDIVHFLYLLETAHQFVIIEKVELAQQGTSLDKSSGALDVGLDVATYYLGG